MVVDIKAKQVDELTKRRVGTYRNRQRSEKQTGLEGAAPHRDAKKSAVICEVKQALGTKFAIFTVETGLPQGRNSLKSPPQQNTNFSWDERVAHCRKSVTLFAPID